MKVSVEMCHSHLMAMLLAPEIFSKCVRSYTATSPDIEGEGFNGNMEVKVEFVINNIELFGKLYNNAYLLPSSRDTWYSDIRNNKMTNVNIEDFK